MTEPKDTVRAAIEEVANQFSFVTDCMTETSTVKRCKQDTGYSLQDVNRIREITTRLEEIRLLLVAYRLKHTSCSLREHLLSDSLEKRARALRAEYAELSAEAKEITNEPLVSKSQAIANQYAAVWYSEES